MLIQEVKFHQHRPPTEQLRRSIARAAGQRSHIQETVQPEGPGCTRFVGEETEAEVRIGHDHLADELGDAEARLDDIGEAPEVRPGQNVPAVLGTMHDRDGVPLLQGAPIMKARRDRETRLDTLADRGLRLWRTRRNGQGNPSKKGRT